MTICPTNGRRANANDRLARPGARPRRVLDRNPAGALADHHPHRCCHVSLSCKSYSRPSGPYFGSLRATAHWLSSGPCLVPLGVDMAQHAQSGPRHTRVLVQIPDALCRNRGVPPGFRRSGSSSGTKFGLLAERRSTTTVSEQCSILFIKTGRADDQQIKGLRSIGFHVVETDDIPAADVLSSYHAVIVAASAGCRP